MYTYNVNAAGKVVGVDGWDLRTLLNLAAAETMIGRPENALSLLSKARLIAREGNTQRDKSVAAHVTAAMQALMPELLAGIEHDAR